MGAMLTLIVLGIAVIFFLFRIRAANKAAAERERREKEDKERRELAQKELLNSLERVKDPGKLEAAKAAIRKDPKRAAKVVSKMMRE